MKVYNLPHYHFTEKPFFIIESLSANGPFQLDFKKTVPYKYEAECFDRPVIISINEEYGKEHDLSHIEGIPILKLKFSDITEKIKLENGNTMNPISGEKCRAVFDFIELYNPDLVLNHCHMGVSRSSAVCLALKYIYNAILPIDFHRFSMPNNFVVGKMIVEFDKMRACRLEE